MSPVFAELRRVPLSSLSEEAYRADRFTVPGTFADLAFPVLWTFQRGDETLTILREIIDGRPSLTVADGRGTRSIPFEDVVALTMYQSDIERQLAGDGWSLAAFAPDLRSGSERRKNARTGRDRRRSG